MRKQKRNYNSRYVKTCSSEVVHLFLSHQELKTCSLFHLNVTNSIKVIFLPEIARYKSHGCKNITRSLINNNCFVQRTFQRCQETILTYLFKQNIWYKFCSKTIIVYINFILCMSEIRQLLLNLSEFFFFNNEQEGKKNIRNIRALW